MAKYLDKSGVTYLWNKIKGLFTDQSLNTKNKTYAGAINEINTKVGNLTGAFLWKGKFDTLPAVTNYEAGNVVGVGNKEYVLTVTGGTKTWEEFGDEGSYLLKTAAEETYLKKTAGEVKTANLADNAVTSTKLAKGARKPIIITGDMTEVDEETYQKLLKGDTDVIANFGEGIFIESQAKFNTGDTLNLIFGYSQFDESNDGAIATYTISINTSAPHILNLAAIGSCEPVSKSTLNLVLQEINLSGTDADRKAKLDQFETDWKALTGASDLTGARFVGRFVITEDIVERNVTGIMTYSAGDTATEANDNCFYGICNGYSFSKQKSQIAVKVSCKDGSLTITPLFSHLEAIAIKTGNTPDNNAANAAAIKAYVDNLKLLGVDTTKGYEIPILYNSGSKGFIGYNPNAASSFNGYAVTPEGNLHTLTMNATTGALSNKILATTAITDALSTNKQPKTDAALKTTSKTVTGAINEVNDKTAYMAFTDVTKLSTNLGKRLIYKGGNVTLSSPITINSNINEIDFNGATLTVGSLAKTGISVITGHSHCIIKNLIISGTWSVNTDVVNNIIDTFAGVENVSIKVVINGTHYGRGFNSCQRLINCKAEIYGTNITAARAYNYCDYLYMCRVGANSKGTGFFHCTSMDSCDIFNGGCTGSELIECSKYTKVSYYVSGNRRYFSDVDNISTKTLQINGINIANIAELSNVIANSSESVNSVPIIDPNDKSIQKMGVVIGNADNGGTGYSDNPTVVVRNTSGNIFINDGHYNGIGCTTNYAAYLVEQNKTDISGKQDKLISGTNIKTVNGQSLLGSGNITISGGGDVTAAGDNTFTGNNVFSGIAIADILDGTQYQITGDNGVLMFTSGATNDDIEISGVATPTYSNSAANKSYVDTQINTALGTVLTQLQNI